MTIDRRVFLANAASAAAVMALTRRAAADDRGRSVADFGVEPNAERDQRAELQNAIHEISAAGHPVFIPAGFYKIGAEVELPSKCIIKGENGQTVLRTAKIGGTIFAGRNPILQISDLILEGKPDNAMFHYINYLVMVQGGTAIISDCTFRHAPGAALQITGAGGIIARCGFYDSRHGAVAGHDVRNLIVRDCYFKECRSGNPDRGGTSCLYAGGEDIRMTGNFAIWCSAGISVSGSGEVLDNTVQGARSAWGLTLAGDNEGRGLVAKGNMLTNCDIGIRLAAKGGTVAISENMISGAKDGAIRAFDVAVTTGLDLVRQGAGSIPGLMVAGDSELRAFDGAVATGPDLAREGAGDYPHLMVAGNVVR
jgi:hypothetical protein